MRRDLNRAEMDEICAGMFYTSADAIDCLHPEGILIVCCYMVLFRTLSLSLYRRCLNLSALISAVESLADVSSVNM